MGTTAVIVQARLGSTRLPGKILMPLNGTAALVHMLTRCLAIPSVDVVVCATVPGESEEAIGPIARALGVHVVAGPEHDVLERYALAAESVDADEVLRVTSDCPLADPTECDRVITARREHGVDYCANNIEVTLPHGLDAEAMTAAALFAAHENATEAHDREHVTPLIRREPQFSRLGVQTGDPQWKRLRWTLDYPEDLAMFEQLFEALDLQPDTNLPWQEVAAFVDAHPEIEAINAGRAVSR